MSRLEKLHGRLFQQLDTSHTASIMGGVKFCYLGLCEHDGHAYYDYMVDDPEPVLQPD